jgi:hypothetical protein
MILESLSTTLKARRPATRTKMETDMTTDPDLKTDSPDVAGCPAPICSGRDSRGRFAKGVQQHSAGFLSDCGKKGFVKRMQESPEKVVKVARENLGKANANRAEWEAKRLAGLRASEKAKKSAGEVSRKYKVERLLARSKNPRSAKGPSHGCATVFHLRDRNNKVYQFKNLAHFIRENESMFSDGDAVWKPIGSSGETCRAYEGLLSLRPFTRDGTPKRRVAGSWKGWTWVSLTEVFHNQGEDLILRPKDPSPNKEARDRSGSGTPTNPNEIKP